MKAKEKFEYKFKGFIEKSRGSDEWVSLSRDDVETVVRFNIGEKKYFDDDVPVNVTIVVRRTPCQTPN